jgi:hypothetical protein
VRVCVCVGGGGVVAGSGMIVFVCVCVWGHLVNKVGRVWSPGCEVVCMAGKSLMEVNMWGRIWWAGVSGNLAAHACMYRGRRGSGSTRG